MAEKKSGGFKTFLLVLVTIILAFVFGCAAYLMLVPESTLFGLKYASNTKKETVERINGGELLRLKDYSKIIINAENGKGHTHVKINAGEIAGMTNSQIVLQKNTKGYMRTNAKSEYSLSCVENGSILTINISEPNYNFLQIANSTVLSLNLYTATDNLTGTNIEINTGSGNVTIGGQITPTEAPKTLSMASVKVNTTSGSVDIQNRAQVNGAVSLITKTGTLRINGDKTFASLYAESNTGKILTDNLTTNVNLKTFNSHIKLGNIIGNVEFEGQSGIFEMGNVSGKLKSENKIKYTTVKAGVVSGAVTLINDEGSFAVDIQETKGDLAIRSGAKPIKIASVGGKAEIETTSGSITIKKSETNNQNIILKTKSGTILANYDVVLGDNTFVTTSGMVKVKFKPEAHFVLNASSEKGRVYRTWLDSNENPLVNVAVGAENSSNYVSITSKSGQIRLERVE